MYVPAGHAAHPLNVPYTAVPQPPKKVPALQRPMESGLAGPQNVGPHDCMPLDDAVPAGHGVHAFELGAENVLAAHAIHAAVEGV